MPVTKMKARANIFNPNHALGQSIIALGRIMAASCRMNPDQGVRTVQIYADQAAVFVIGMQETGFRFSNDDVLKPTGCEETLGRWVAKTTGIDPEMVIHSGDQSIKAFNVYADQARIFLTHMEHLPARHRHAIAAFVSHVH